MVAEADKRRSGKLSQLLVLVTDDAADTIEAEVFSLKTRVPVVVVGPSTHKQYYAQAGAFVKSCFAVSQAASDAASDAGNRQELAPESVEGVADSGSSLCCWRGQQRLGCSTYINHRTLLGLNAGALQFLYAKIHHTFHTSLNADSCACNGSSFLRDRKCT